MAEGKSGSRWTNQCDSFYIAMCFGKLLDRSCQHLPLISGQYHRHNIFVVKEIKKSNICILYRVHSCVPGL